MYLVYVPQADAMHPYQAVAVLYPKVQQWHEIFSSKIVYGVTHWRPLPKPPKDTP